MAYLVTNPRRLPRRRRLVHNGAINIMIFKKLGLTGKVNAPENQAQIKAFKRTEGYAAWKAGLDLSETKASMAVVRDTITAASAARAAEREAEKEMKSKSPDLLASFRERRRAAAAARSNPRRKHRKVKMKAKMKAKHLRKNRKHSRKHARKGLLKFRRNFGGAFGSGVASFVRSDLTIGTVGGFAIAGVAHYFLVPKVSDALDMLGEKVSMLQPVTTAITTYVPYTSTGFVGGVLAGGIAALAGRPQLGLSLGSAVFGVGVAIDALAFFQNRAEAAAVPSEMGNIAYGRTLRDAYGGTVVTDFSGTVVTDFGAASMADAAVCGDDFAADEGQALLDGPAAMAALAGPIPVSAGARSSGYSRFAGRRMARWYWLVKCVGLQRAQQIAALSPEKRVKLLTDLRKQALASLDAALLQQSASYGSLFESANQQYGAFVYAGAGY